MHFNKLVQFLSVRFTYLQISSILTLENFLTRLFLTLQQASHYMKSIYKPSHYVLFWKIIWLTVYVSFSVENILPLHGRHYLQTNSCKIQPFCRLPRPKKFLSCRYMLGHGTSVSTERSPCFGTTSKIYWGPFSNQDPHRDHCEIKCNYTLISNYYLYLKDTPKAFPWFWTILSFLA